MAIFDISCWPFCIGRSLWLIRSFTRVRDRSDDRYHEVAEHPFESAQVLSFRLVLAIGVDYGIYVVIVWKNSGHSA